ncbi:hypothetical protein KR067_010777, partial [Drosophila pandora]
MNPACKLSLESPECQDWMSEVCAHCSHLLPDPRQAELWDTWWPDEPAAPFKPRVSLMSAYDCHKLRKEVAREVAKRDKVDEHDHGLGEGDHPVEWTLCRIILVILVLATVLLSIICAFRMLIGGIRRLWKAPSPPSSPCTVEEKQKTPPPKNDVESTKPPPDEPSKPSKHPRSFLSFGRNSDPRTRYGPYNNQKLFSTAPSPEQRLSST